MNADSLLIHVAVLAAALLQTVTGVGFGAVVGPLLLIALNSNSAVHVSIMLNLLIALAVAPSLLRAAKISTLKQLSLGTVLGLPVGLGLFLWASVDALKILAAVVILAMVLLSLRGRKPGPPPGPGRLSGLSVGIVSGVLCSALAMPGPVAAAHMSGLRERKDVLRATILVFFVFAYGGALILQSAVVGISGPSLRLALTLAPATVLGVLLGRGLADRISERWFRGLLLATLVATIIGLFASVLGGG